MLGIDHLIGQLKRRQGASPSYLRLFDSSPPRGLSDQGKNSLLRAWIGPLHHSFTGEAPQSRGSQAHMRYGCLFIVVFIYWRFSGWITTRRDDSPFDLTGYGRKTSYFRAATSLCSFSSHASSPFLTGIESEGFRGQYRRLRLRRELHRPSGVFSTNGKPTRSDTTQKRNDADFNMLTKP